MLKRRYLALILVLVLLLATIGVYYTQQAKPSRNIYSGFWSTGFGTAAPDLFVNLTKQMASITQGLSTGNILAVGTVLVQEGTCILTFPSNETYPHMSFSISNLDRNEASLTAFDENGVKVWLEVEPGFADINQLIDVVLKRYGHHPSVQGFSIDLEWHWDWPNKWLIPVTDEEANQWLNKTKSYNPDYKLLLIHWLTEVMPHATHQDIVFIGDKQNWPGLNWLVDGVKLWGENFSQRDVGYIIGFRRDLEWMSKLENPPREIGLALTQNIPNCHFIFWSYETILEVFLE